LRLKFQPKPKLPEPDIEEVKDGSLVEEDEKVEDIKED